MSKNLWTNPPAPAFGSPPAQTWTPASYHVLRDFDVAVLDDAIYFASGSTIWTSTSAHRDALGIVKPRETTLRELIDGERPWKVETERTGSMSFVDNKKRQKLAEYDERLARIGVVRNVLRDDQEPKAVLGYRVRFDDRDVVTELSKLAPMWEIRADHQTDPHRIGPIFLPDGVFDLTDGGVVIVVTVWIDGPPVLGLAPRDASTSWLGRRAFTSVEDAVRYGVATINRASTSHQGDDA